MKFFFLTTSLSLLHYFFISFLGKRGIKDEICMFDARSISNEVRESVEEILKTKESSFDPKVSCAVVFLYFIFYHPIYYGLLWIQGSQSPKLFQTVWLNWMIKISEKLETCFP